MRTTNDLRSRHTETPGQQRRHGFTLVELLVVVSIIALLAALLLPAVYNALATAEDAAIRIELGNLAAAVELYKNEFRAYPPNFINQAAVARHIGRLFPRNVDTIPTGLDQSEALVFWLSGFKPDPQRPFTGVGERTPLYSFTETQLIDHDGDGFPSYVPKNGIGAPYVYFDSRSYSPSHQFAGSGQGVAIPYQSITGGYVNPKSFQIVSAGQDGDYGTSRPSAAPVFPTGTNYVLGDMDNLTNFATSTLKSALE